MPSGSSQNQGACNEGGGDTAKASGSGQSGKKDSRNRRKRFGAQSNKPPSGNRQLCCYDCDEVGHYYGDDSSEYPSVYTKKKNARAAAG